MSIDSITGVVEAAIQRASNVTGVDFTFLLGAARRESGYNPGAHAPTSSAAGLFQFVEQTWMSTLKAHGAKYGYARYADLISKGSDGRFHVRGAEARKAVMDLRFDPHAASLMAGELASDHASYLRGRMGRDPTSGELYAAHFLGSQGSARLIEAMQSRPQAPAAALFPDAAQANHSIFYREGRAASVSEVYTNLTRAPGPGGFNTLHTQPAAPPPQADFVKYATARRIDRVDQEQALIDMVLRGPEEPDHPSGGGLSGSLFSAEMLRALTVARGSGG
jgi:hypothetical protein